jgi:hypothetical protein
LLPGAVLRLPVKRTITLPSGLLLVHLIRAPALCRPVVLLLPLLLTMLLLFRLSPLLLFLWFLMLVLACVSRSSKSQKQKQCCCTEDSNCFHTRGSEFISLPFIQMCLSPNADTREGMKQSKYIQEPQHHADDHNRVQDRLDAACHGDETIHQPQEDAHYDKG